MRIAAIIAGLIAAVSLPGPASASPFNVSAESGSQDIDYKCAFRISFQLIGYVSTGSAIGAAALCSKSDGGDGYVAGAFSLTTKHGTALAAINEYKQRPAYNKEFDALIPTLEKYNETMSGSTDGLDAFCNAWTTAAKNEYDFYGAQIKVIRDMYEGPALEVARSLNIRYPLTRSAMTNVALMGGLGKQGDALGAVVAAANAGFAKDVKGTSGNSVKVGNYAVDEVVWLDAFLDAWDKLSNGASSSKSKIYASLYKNNHLQLDDMIAFTGFDNQPVSFKCEKLF
ncbi:hypothetical protein IWQ57_001811 [Coemansia nantahalensis]|uniref:Uncharacterized protein n=1 Tax=Coemansia nantahalensis TaxID=2789366 RepID=A0ACC1K3F9_9FUNG|nr:hypothetical protein IWQ57_001811 [Coemansia nantahalensis]